MQSLKSSSSLGKSRYLNFYLNIASTSIVPPPDLKLSRSFFHRNAQITFHVNTVNCSIDCFLVYLRHMFLLTATGEEEGWVGLGGDEMIHDPPSLLVVISARFQNSAGFLLLSHRSTMQLISDKSGWIAVKICFCRIPTVWTHEEIRMSVETRMTW